MKRVVVYLVCLLLLVLGVNAVSLSNVFSGLSLSDRETAVSPRITNYYADPLKVMLGQDLRIVASFEDDFGVEKATVSFPFEGGEDVLEMELIDGTSKKGTLTATWTAHDTRNRKWYYSTIVLTNKMGKEASIRVAWEDPTVSHPAAQVSPGSFQNGNYSFPNGNVDVVGNLLVNGTGTSKIITTDLQVWDDAEGANDYVKIYHDGTNGFIFPGSGSLRMGTIFSYAGGNGNDLGISSIEWRGLYLGEDAGSGVFLGLDQDWQLYHNSTTDNLILKEGTADRMTWLNNSASVGIGTAPVSGIGLTMNSPIRSTIFYDNSDTNYYLDPHNTGTSATLAGNVGIGTTTPGGKLSVEGIANANGAHFEGTSARNDPLMTINGDNVAGGNNDNTLTKGLLVNITSNFDSQNIVDFQNNGVSRFLVKGGTGYVGIGTTAPASALDVVGNIIVNVTAGQSGITMYDENHAARCMKCWSNGVCNSSAGVC